MYTLKTGLRVYYSILLAVCIASAETVILNAVSGTGSGPIGFTAEGATHGDDCSAPGGTTSWYTGKNPNKRLYVPMADTLLTETDTIYSVTVRVLAKADDDMAGTYDGIRMALRLGNKESRNRAINELTTEYAYYDAVWATNPTTGDTWTWEEVCDIQAGVFTAKKRQLTYSTYYVDHIQLIVTYGNGNEPPEASDVLIDGIIRVGETLTGTYVYSDREDDPEDVSLFKWYRAESANPNDTLIAVINGATSLDYALTNIERNRYVSFEVTPVATQGVLVGLPVMSPFVGPVVNNPPVLAEIGPQSTAEGTQLTFTTSATDPDNDPVTITADPLPSGATFDGTTFEWTPDYDAAASSPYSVTFTASDGDLTDEEIVEITVTNTNRAPILAAIGSKTIAEGTLLTFTTSATDPDNDPVTITATPLSDATFDGTTFEWTPDYNAAASSPYSVTFTASDGDLTDEEIVEITVTDVALYTVTFTAGSNGSITGTLSQTVPHGGSCTEVTAEPEAEYHFAGWTGDYTGTDNPLTVTNVTSDMAITANFAANTFQLTVTAGTGGTITEPASSPVTVNNGEATTITADPETGYGFENWTVTSGTADIADATLASTTVTLTSGDATVNANFTINQYTVTFVEGSNGSITGDLSQTVDHGGSCTEVTAVPSTGYHFIRWTGDYTGAENPLTVTNVTSDMTITAYFDMMSDITNNINKSASGQVFVVSPNVVTVGNTVSFLFRGKGVTHADLVIYDVVGNALYKNSYGSEINSNKLKEFDSWNLKNMNGRKTAGGTYLAFLIIKNSDGSVQKIKAMFGIKKL
jgi:hypothetical protein